MAQHGAASLIHGGNRDTEETDTRRPRPHGTRCDETLCDRFTRRGGFLDARLWVWARLWRAAACWASRWMRGQKRACESATPSTVGLAAAVMGSDWVPGRAGQPRGHQMMTAFLASANV